MAPDLYGPSPLRRLFRKQTNVAFVATGGGNKGCLQGGHIAAVRWWLERRKQEPLVLRALVGNSIGAFNLAHWAWEIPDRDLREFWRKARRSSFGTYNANVLIGFLNRKWRGHILNPAPLKGYLELFLPPRWDLFEHRFYVGVSAYSRSGQEMFGFGIKDSMLPLAAVLTSMAVPGLYPQVPWQGSYWGDAACMLNKIPIMDEHCGPDTVTFVSLLGYAGLSDMKAQAKFWPWEWSSEAREKISYEEFKREIEGWGESVSEHVRFCPKRGWLVVLHNLEGRKLAPYDFSQGEDLYEAGQRKAGEVILEFEECYLQSPLS